MVPVPVLAYANTSTGHMINANTGMGMLIPVQAWQYRYWKKPEKLFFWRERGPHEMAAPDFGQQLFSTGNKRGQQSHAKKMLQFSNKLQQNAAKYGELHKIVINCGKLK